MVYNQPVVLVIDAGVHAVPHADDHPVFDSDRTRPVVGGSLPDFVVLQADIDVVGLLIVDLDHVDFAEGQVMVVHHRFAAVPCLIDSAIRTEKHVVAVFGIDPKSTVVAEIRLEQIGLPAPRPGLSAVKRVEHSGPDDEDLVRIIWSDTDFVEAVTCFSAHVDFFWIIQSFPRLSCIEGTITLASDEVVKRVVRKLIERNRRVGIGTFLEIEILYDRNKNVGIVMLEIDADAAERAFRKSSLRQAFP